MATSEGVFASELQNEFDLLIETNRTHFFAFVGRRAVAFGTTLDRELLPLKVPANRFGNELGLRGAPNRGPGCYDNAEVTKRVACFLAVCFCLIKCLSQSVKRDKTSVIDR